MAYMQVREIKLQYDEATIDIERIAEIIKLNQYLFTYYKDKGKIISLGTPILSEGDNIVYISDFDNFFDDLLKIYLGNKSIINSLNHPDLLIASYIQLLTNKATQNGDTPILFDNNISDDIVWFMVACKFFDYKTKFSDLSNFLKYRDDSDRIFNWLKESQRFKTYNYLLKVTSNVLREYDLSFLDNIDEILSKMDGENLAYALSLPQKTKRSEYDIPKMPLEDFEKIFFDFLNSIRAPYQWKNLYIKLKNETRILFEESIDGLNHSAVFRDADGILKIRVTTDGTIRCFVSFVHEFMHYVSLQGNVDALPFSLLEFPSIYYERIAANYLISIGFNENIIKRVIKDRNQNNLDIYSSISGILWDINIYNKKGIITRDDKIKPLKKTMEVIYKARSDLAKTLEKDGKPIEDLDSSIIPSDNKLGEIVDKECDGNISRFIKKGVLVLNGYQYLTDSYLADSVLEKQNDDTILDKMIFVTEHLEDFNIKKIINYLGIGNAFVPKSRNKK